MMVPLNTPELSRVVGILRKYDPKSTITQLAGLLTAPNLQANTIRIETLVHLAVARCKGRRKPGLPEISKWINKHLGRTQVALLEDPVEDVFVTNVKTPAGNRRIFEGIWESNDYFVQVLLDTLASPDAPQDCRDLLAPIYALLKISDCLAERVGLQRWHYEPSIPKDAVNLTAEIRLTERARSVIFTESDLNELGINREVLSPFIVRAEDKHNILKETIGHTTLERYPLIEIDGDLVIALPSAISPAIRRFALFEIKNLDYLEEFATALAGWQAHQVETNGLLELKGETDSLEPPSVDGISPSLHTWLLKYDTNKYLHVVLLHDNIYMVESDGLSGFMKYPEKFRAGLEEYLSKVSNHCKSLSGFTDGTTLLVLGGLGRGFVMGFKDWPYEWSLSVIHISELLMLGDEINRSITRYLKCIKQREWAERNGVYIQNINGDYNLYCFWRQTNYQLVPRDLPVDEGSMLCIGNDMVRPVREEVRKLVDHQVMLTTAGNYIPVVRFGRDAFFKSMRDRPIYVALEHLRRGVLAGAVETERGPSWFLVETMSDNYRIRRLFYEMWSGFLGLYDRLVFEVESLYSNASTGAIEVRCNFTDAVIHDDNVDPNVCLKVDEPRVTINLNDQIADIHFPSDFLSLFQQPANTGEKSVLRGIAKGLICLYQRTEGDIEEAVLDILMDKVIGSAGMRIIHILHTYYPIEYLLARQDQNPNFLAHEDFVFSKLKLSENCTSVKPGAIIKHKSECNDFLHKIVDKVWYQIRDKLRELDRTSVICSVIQVHESIIHDRDHWRNTAQAILALYASDDDVFAVAREREADRTNVSVACRTILEMAICESPEINGRQLTGWGMDELLAKGALLVEVAMDSDAINSDLIEPWIQLHSNGEYTINREFHNTVIKPFAAAYYREAFEGAASDYHKLYQSERPGDRKRTEEIYSSEFIHAFHTEFGLCPDEAIDGFAELMDMAVEQDNVVVQTTLGELRTRLTETREMSHDACDAFIHTFSIFHRPAWDTPPSGFKLNDLYPWRFRRRLSATARPIFIFGKNKDSKVIYGAGALKLGFGYLLERSERGDLPQEFYVSKEMKRYIGSVNNERGQAFAQSVVDKMREHGWEARHGVRMTELGGPADYGDIDVMAWRSNGEIELIECKRLQLARTVAEVSEICRRFRGEAKDELAKHTRRVAWIRDNPNTLQPIVGFVPDPNDINDRLVTNTHVPMKYLTSLPIDADKIGPLQWLEESH